MTSSKVVLRVVYSAEIRVHHEDSLESKMELEFVDRVGTAVVSRHRHLVTRMSSL